MISKYINNITQGNCIELLKDIESETVDMVFADPPFNLKKGYNSYKDSLELEKYLEWCKKWITELVRITKSTGSIFIHNIPKWLTYYSIILNELADFKHWISWKAPTAPMGKTLQPSHYGILFYAKHSKHLSFYEIREPHKRTRKSNILEKDYGGKKYLLHPFGPLISDVWTDIHRIKHNKYRDEHPCQLPFHLLERIILMSTNENDIVLDPFMGTGTTAIAAKRLGRNFIGFELDEKYAGISHKKIEAENYESKIGKSYVSFYLDQVVTLRDCDWDYLKGFFDIPDDITEIDKKPISLKSKPIITNPLKDKFNNIDKNISLFENVLTRKQQASREHIL
jgi:site-specific DNA-methyltransferase (adenine-specific)